MKVLLHENLHSNILDAEFNAIQNGSQLKHYIIIELQQNKLKGACRKLKTLKHEKNRKRAFEMQDKTQSSFSNQSRSRMCLPATVDA
jgi:hypothetical protein